MMSGQCGEERSESLNCRKEGQEEEMWVIEVMRWL